METSAVHAHSHIGLLHKQVCNAWFAGVVCAPYMHIPVGFAVECQPRQAFAGQLVTCTVQELSSAQ